jgi:hypothetical protein
MAAQRELEPVYNAKDYRYAFLVGWRFAQLNANTTHTKEILAVKGEEGYLPELPVLSSEQRTLVIWSRLKLELSELPGGNSPKIQEEVQLADQLLAKESFEKPAVTTAIQAAFNTTVVQVYVTQPHLSKAIDLGLQLANLVFGPANVAAQVSVALNVQFDEKRVKMTCSLLEELQSAFPLRAAAAVSGSLVYWQHWVIEHSRDDGAVRDKLRSQGEQWQSLLTGEIRADDLLNLQDYRQAIKVYMGQVAGLWKKNPLLWKAVLTLLAACGGGIWAIVTYAPKGAAVVAAIIATAAGALGITWKTITATVGKVAALLERPMLNDGLSEAVKNAAFIPPPDMTAAQIAELRDEVRKEIRQDGRETNGKQGTAEQPKRRQWPSLPRRSKPAIEASAGGQAQPDAGSQAPDSTVPSAEENTLADREV